MPTNDERREVAARIREYVSENPQILGADDSESTPMDLMLLGSVRFAGRYPTSDAELLGMIASLIEPEPVLSGDIVDAIKGEIWEDNVFIHLIDDEHVLVVDREPGKKAHVYVAPRYEKTCHVEAYCFADPDEAPDPEDDQGKPLLSWLEANTVRICSACRFELHNMPVDLSYSLNDSGKGYDVRVCQAKFSFCPNCGAKVMDE
jgi:hypothetical protein